MYINNNNFISIWSGTCAIFKCNRVIIWITYRKYNIGASIAVYTSDNPAGPVGFNIFSL